MGTDKAQDVGASGAFLASRCSFPEWALSGSCRVLLTSAGWTLTNVKHACSLDPSAHPVVFYLKHRPLFPKRPFTALSSSHRPRLCSAPCALTGPLRLRASTVARRLTSGPRPSPPTHCARHLVGQGPPSTSPCHLPRPLPHAPPPHLLVVLSSISLPHLLV